MQYQDLRLKWWWRFLQVLFSLTFLVILVLTLAIVYPKIPKSPIEDIRRSYYICDDGTKHYLADIGADASNLSQYDDQLMRRECLGNHDLSIKNEPIPVKNYYIKQVYISPIYSQLVYIWALVLMILLELVVFLGIRSLVLYIITGKFRKRA